MKRPVKQVDEPPSVVPPSPYDSAGFISKAFFSWAGDIIAKGYRRELVMNDLPDVSKGDDSAVLFAKFKNEWNKELVSAKRANRPVSLLMAVLRSFFRGNFEIVLYIMVESGVRVYQAKVLGMMIGYFLGSKNSETVPLYNNGWFLSALLVICGLAITAVHHQFFFYGWRLGMRLRIVLTAAIYEKSVRLNLRALSRTAAGHIVNLCSQDVEAFQQAGLFVHFTYEPILEAGAVLYVGIEQVGVSFLAGFAAIILLIPLQSFFSKLLNSARKSTSISTDERLKLVSQALSGVRLMKINGWEGAFTSLIESVRENEVHSLMKTNYLRAVNEAIFFAAPIIVGCFTFVTYVRTGGVLNPQKVFTVLTLFSIVQFSMTKFLAYAVQFLSESMVAINRIQNLLLMDEKERESETVDTSTGGDRSTPSYAHSNNQEDAKKYFSGSVAAELLKNDDIIVRLENVSASWTHEHTHERTNTDKHTSGHLTSADDEDHKKDHQLHLTDFSLDVLKGELVVVVGPVGCSKSTLIMALLGELLPINGAVYVSSHKKESQEHVQERSRDDAGDAIAYCAQEPWIMSVSVRDNILFGTPFDEAKYWATIEACALSRDLEELPNGDQTIIGDKGVNLSGGQRARVGLARALYSTAPLVLLDDPLSAVDAKVGRHLFQRAICDEKCGLGGRTRILTTHQVQFLSSPSVSRIVVMKSGGQIAASGTYAQLMAAGELDWIGTIPQHELNEEDGSEGENRDVNPEKMTSDDAKKSSDGSNAGTTDSKAVKKPENKDAEQSANGGDIDRSKMDGTSEAATTEAKKSIIVAENKESGEVRWSTYVDYIAQMGGPMIGLMLAGLMLLGQGLSIATNVWLAHWAGMSPEEQKKDWGMGVYIGFVVAAVIASVVRSFVVFKYCLLASKRLHNNMLKCVVRAPVSFFDSNPLGRIINRFAKDIGFADDNLPMTMYDFFQCALMVVGAVAVVGAGCPYVFIALAPLLWYFAALRNYYLKTSREVKRLEAISRSPLFSHITHSLDGLVSLRAYKRVAHFTQEHKQLLNANTRGYFCFVATSRWLGFRLDAMAVALLAASTFGSVAAYKFTDAVNPYTLAVGIMYVIQLAGLFQWCVRQSAEVENMMVSVERVLAYSRIPSEADLHGPKDLSQRPQWPEAGGIEAKQIICSYRLGLPPVLKGVSFKITPGQRVGVVGRTGAGKSTLMSVLLRLLDLDSGSLLIDGVDISEVGLHDLRPKISVIPQTPFLFSGTMRQNMDPFGRFTDAEIWSALDCVGMKTAVQKLRRDKVTERAEKVEKEEIKMSVAGSRTSTKIANTTSSSRRSQGKFVGVSGRWGGAQPSTGTARGAEEADEVQVGIHPDHSAESHDIVHSNAPADCEHVDTPEAVEDGVLVVSVAGGLDGRVEENGGNFSVGERQLLCLARALLQRNRILLLDEATANVDMETDALVQRAVRQEFGGCTVVMVAHRLQTIIDCDQVLVFAAGEITEAGHPHELLRKYLGDVSSDIRDISTADYCGGDVHTHAQTLELGSVPVPAADAAAVVTPKDTLASLVTETGPAMAMKLRVMAAAAYKDRR